jgi:hypothetical protein
MLLAAAALVFFVLGILYWTGTVQIGTSHPGHHHAHAIVLFVLGIVALVAMRFQSGASSPSKTR